jgi:mannose-6-phosphate isomerase-like protein (cupin superfamily)
VGTEAQGANEGTGGPRAPTVLRPGEGEHIAAGASSLTLKATGETTGGTLFMSDSVLAPGFPGPPPHVHERLHDMFLVLEGTLTMRLGDEELQAGPGTFVCVPPGVVHTFANRSDAPVRFLNLNTPSGFEAYMRELGQALASGMPPTPEEIGRIASRYDFRAV